LTPHQQYSNIAFAIAGEAAANVAGVPYEQLVRDKIFRPLGLAHTGFSQIEMSKRPNHAMPFYADSLKDAQEGRFHEGYLDNFDEMSAAAGDVYSNVYDLVKWGSTIMHLGELEGHQVLNRESVKEQLKAHTIARQERSFPEFAPSKNYGFGWSIDSYRGQAMYWHSKFQRDEQREREREKKRVGTQSRVCTIAVNMKVLLTFRTFCFFMN
jgi:CubicO group peptidase (beta-lactamase class C family)